MGDFLSLIGIVVFAVVMLGLIKGLERVLTAVQGFLLGISILVFVYLSVAMFKPERF